MSPKGSPAPRPVPGVSADVPDFRVKADLDPYAAVSLSSDRLGRDGDEAEPASTPPYPHRQRTIDRFGSVGDSDRRRGAESVQGSQAGDGTTSRPRVPNLGDAHFTPGTLQREHDHEGYTKTRTRPRGQGGGTDSGARQAECGTRGVEGGTPTGSAGPFAPSPDASRD